MRTLITLARLAPMLFASCAQVAVLGPHKDAISRADVAQIKQVVWQHPYLRNSDLFIRPLGRNSASVQSGSSAANAGTYHTFIVRRSHGQWTVDESTELANAVVSVE